MSNYACPRCNIVYHMISDSMSNPVCKKCGHLVVYWDEDDVKQFGPVKVLHDFSWSSDIVTPDMIDPDYEPRGKDD